MVLTIGLAFAVVYRFEVPARDTLIILWGNLFALTAQDLWITMAFSGIVRLPCEISQQDQ